MSSHSNNDFVNDFLETHVRHLKYICYIFYIFYRSYVTSSSNILHLEGGENDPVKQWASGSRKRNVKEPHSSQRKNPRTLEGSPSKTSLTPCLQLSPTRKKLSQRGPLYRQVSLSTFPV
jgi:hypothetical protein